MPIGYAPAYNGSFGTISVPGAMAGPGGVRANAAVAIVDLGSGPQIVECSAQYMGDKFLGFAAVSANEGSITSIITTRGSNVSPIVETGVSLIPNGRVYLSSTRGAVTQTPPPLNIAGVFIQLGMAVTDNVMVVITDTRHVVPG